MDKAHQPTCSGLIATAKKQAIGKDTRSCRERRKFLEMIVGIPEYEMESLARMLLPILKKYIDSEEGKRDWQEWQALMKDGANCTVSTESKEEMNLSDRN